ncbi:solute carrier family 35 member D3 [Menidia menidia]
MEVLRTRRRGIVVAVAHGVFSGSLNLLLKLLITRFSFRFLTVLQLLTSLSAALTLEALRRRGAVRIPAFSLKLSKEFSWVCVLSTLQSTLTLWSLRGLSLPMYVVFKRCLPLVTLSVSVCLLRNGAPSAGVLTAVLITTGGAVLAGAGDLTGEPVGYVTGVLAVIVHASYLVLIQKTSLDSEYGPLTAQYAVAVMATPVMAACSLASSEAIGVWSYEGWRQPAIAAIFPLCVVIGCAMNFTTLQCTYINSAVTTSFVGVVKSVATITVGMLAFEDVAPTRLFVGGVVVNTVGSITYCVVKYQETKRKSSYQDLEEEEEESRDANANAVAGGDPGRMEAADGERLANGTARLEEVKPEGIREEEVKPERMREAPVEEEAPTVANDNAAVAGGDPRQTEAGDGERLANGTARLEDVKPEGMRDEEIKPGMMMEKKPERMREEPVEEEKRGMMEEEKRGMMMEGVKSGVMTEAELLQMQREHLHRAPPPRRPPPRPLGGGGVRVRGRLEVHQADPVQEGGEARGEHGAGDAIETRTRTQDPNPGPEPRI